MSVTASQIRSHCTCHHLRRGVRSVTYGLDHRGNRRKQQDHPDDTTDRPIRSRYDLLCRTRSVTDRCDVVCVRFDRWTANLQSASFVDRSVSLSGSTVKFTASGPSAAYFGSTVPGLRYLSIMAQSFNPMISSP